jgi:hypothetical protein
MDGGDAGELILHTLRRKTAEAGEECGVSLGGGNGRRLRRRATTSEGDQDDRRK